MRTRERVTVDLSNPDLENLKAAADRLGVKPTSLVKMALKKTLAEIETEQAITIPFARRAQPESVEGGSDEQ